MTTEIMRRDTVTQLVENYEAAVADIHKLIACCMTQKHV